VKRPYDIHWREGANYGRTTFARTHRQWYKRNALESARNISLRADAAGTVDVYHNGKIVARYRKGEKVQ
jgi:hypothetical protein